MNLDTAVTERVRSLHKQSSYMAEVEGPGAIRQPEYGFIPTLSDILAMLREDQPPLPPEYAMQDYWEPRNES